MEQTDSSVYVVTNAGLAGVLMTRGFEIIAHFDAPPTFIFPAAAQKVAERIAKAPRKLKSHRSSALPKMRGGGGRWTAPSNWEPRA